MKIGQPWLQSFWPHFWWLSPKIERVSRFQVAVWTCSAIQRVVVHLDNEKTFLGPLASRCLIFCIVMKTSETVTIWATFRVRYILASFKVISIESPFKTIWHYFAGLIAITLIFLGSWQVVIEKLCMNFCHIVSYFPSKSQQGLPTPKNGKLGSHSMTKSFHVSRIF